MPQMMKCVKNITINEKDCLNSCEGLFITGFERREFEEDQDKRIKSLVNDDYEKYKAEGLPEFPYPIKGILNSLKYLDTHIPNKFPSMEKQSTIDCHLF